MTRIQSLPRFGSFGGLKSIVPSLVKESIFSALPVLGSNHHAVNLLPEILPNWTVMFWPVGMYRRA